LNPTGTRRASFVSECLKGSAPVVAATDYVVAYPSLIAPFLEARFVALGTDGFGRSDTRANLRKFFEVDRHHIVVAALGAIADEGGIAADRIKGAPELYQLESNAAAPWAR
jgi:pyruvate dehydrogenase E1 component